MDHHENSKAQKGYNTKLLEEALRTAKGEQKAARELYSRSQIFPMGNIEASTSLTKLLA